MAYQTDPVTGGLGASRLNPFRTFSSAVYPRTIDQVLIWAQWFWDRNAKYRTVIQKVISYFVSGINVTQTNKNESSDTDAVADVKAMLIDQYDLLNFANRVGVELAAMGNVFISCEKPISRMLLCPTEDCGWIMALKQLIKGKEYEWDGKHFTGTCPKCGRKVIYKIHDQETTDAEGRKVKFVFRDPQDMYIQYNRLTDTFLYYYKMPDDIRNAILRGDPVYLQNTPQVFLEAASEQALIQFHEEDFFAARTYTLSTSDRRYKGWGLPLFMPSFDNMLRLQHLDKFNEAITLDYIAPTRIVSPQPQNLQAGLQDPNRAPLSGNMFKSFIESSLRRVKENPTTWIVSPVPVQYQLIGGEGKELAPVDLMEWYVTQFNSDTGIPQEFRQTTFQVVAPSMGMRMFERQWRPNTRPIDKCVRWAGQHICDVERAENMRVTLDVTSFVEDDMNKQMRFSLMQGGVISKTETLRSLGIEFEEDVKTRINEMKKEQELMQKEKKDQQDREMVGGVIPPTVFNGVNQAQGVLDAQLGVPQDPNAPAQPGAPMAPAAPAAPAAPSDTEGGGAPLGSVWQQATDEANRLYTMPPDVRRRELVNMKATNPELHAAVNQILRNMKQDVASQAVAASQQPQQ